MNYDKIVRYETHLQVKRDLTSMTELCQRQKDLSQQQHQALKECQYDRGRAWADIEDLRNLVTKCYEFFAGFPQSENDDVTKFTQDCADELHRVCRYALGEEADDA